MQAKKQRNRSPFVKLDEQVSLASSSERVVKTTQVGRVIGFGCNQDEQDALEALKNFSKQARENPQTASDPTFRQKLHEHVQKLEEAIASSHGNQSGQ